MSLDLTVDVDHSDGAGRLAVAIGVVMTACLLVAAWEQSRSDSAGGRWWLPLGCALACAAWSGLLYRRGSRRSALRVRLRVTADGLLRLSSLEGGESVAVAATGAWGLGGLICLRIRAETKVDPASLAANDPQSATGLGSGERVLLLARCRCPEAQWHALRRWLLWHRRSRHGESGPA